MTSKHFIQNKLKTIFSNKNIVLNSLNFCKKNYLNPKHLQYIKFSISKFLACRDLSKGFVSFKCPNCPITHKFPLSCKSRLCPSCGYKYSQLWTDNIHKHILNIPHRHVLFTIPKACRMFFFYDRNLLSKLSVAVNDIFKFHFHNISKKNKRINKISKSSKFYFTDSDILHYGLISVIHTFGRDLKWNPHIHAIVSLGGFNKNFDFKKLEYFNVNTIAGQWKYHVLDIISKGNYPNQKIKRLAKITVNKLYSQNARFFFNVGSGDVNNIKGIIKYLGRYLARSPIAEYKITDITDNEVTFFYNDLANDKQKTFITMPIQKFVSQILIHVPPKNFKMVNRYGLYARRISNKLKSAVIPFKKNIVPNKLSFYQRQTFKTFGINPFYCPVCNIRMIVWEFYHYLYPELKRYY